ncbi:MAG: VOC family protein, partial [Phycisphaerae bacterium]|nr:VOC family protein [Phycisphaerae bacterium]
MIEQPSPSPIRLAGLRLLARDATAQRDFYEKILGLPVTADSGESVTVRSNGTAITFVEVPLDPGVNRLDPYYHFAFNIPENQVNEALDWTRARVPIIKNAEGNEIVFFESWNAHAFYFFDPAGNIVEFIARHTLTNASTRPFGPASILEASEIGLVVQDVAAATRQIERDLGATPYRPPSPEF